MNKKKKIALFCINFLLCALIAICAGFFMQGWSITIRVVCYCIAAVGAIFEAVVFILNKDALFKSGFVIVVCVTLVVVAIAIVNEACDLKNYPTDEEKIERLKSLIRDLGVWGYVVYFLLQVLQVVVLPFPALVCYVPGSAIWGPLTATLIASAGVIVGSLIAYFIGKCCGKPAVVWIAGKENTEKYAAVLSKRGKVLFLMMQILPFFPDDILCIVAGLVGMNFPFFVATIVLVRPLIIAAYCYLGSGTVIPFSGWGIPVWIAIFAVCIILAVLSFKYQDRFEAWLVKKIKRKNRNEEEGEVNGEENLRQAVTAEAENFSSAKNSEEVSSGVSDNVKNE